MPDTDIPAILAVADSLAPLGTISEQQRQQALQAIEAFRAMAPQFLDEAMRIIQAGNIKDIYEVVRVTNLSCHLSTALTKICEPLWTMERAEFQRGVNAIQGKGESKHA